MSFQELYVSLGKVMNTLIDAWPAKLAASFLVAILASRPTKLLLLFVILVVFDLITRWIALSRKHLDDQNAEEKGLHACVLNMRKARAAGYIQSGPMKHRFAGKFIWYSLMCLVAATLDINLATMGEPQYFVKLFVAYMGASEAMSILENMQEAGVEQAGDLLDLVKMKRGGRRDVR